ncbi:MAG: zinc-binding alcohol dehydrogenase family protein [Acidobacteria bacterium]|nr:zinc-binding alcohol dehydrogenase family protein [Acidobacteriota bacterium]
MTAKCAVRAAVLEAIGAEPVLGERPEPVAADGEEVVDVLAVALNPVDLAIGGGRFYAGHPVLPYVPGHEAVVRRPSGALAYASGGGLGVARDGLLAERAAVPVNALIDLPAGTDPGIAVALGTAGLAGWLSVEWRAGVGEGDVVVVLGATGAVGKVALQAARACGAARTVAVARSAARLAAADVVADATVEAGDRLAERVLEAAGAAPTVVIDTTWGPNLVAMLGIAATRARVVHLGASAGPATEIPSAPLRGKQIDLLGFSNFGVPRDVLVAAYRQMVGLAASGALVLSVSRYPIGRVAEAWRAATAGEAKVVIETGGSQ